jgi:anthranilate synthase component 1
MSRVHIAVPHRREFLADSLTPLGVYRRLVQLSSFRFLLESVTGGEQVSRYSFLGAGPREIFRLYPDRLEVQEPDGPARRLPGPPLEALQRAVEEVSSPAETRLVPFSGGLVGYFGYDTVRLLEHLPERPPDPFGLPLALLGRFDSVLVFDHARQRVIAVANEIEGIKSAAEAERELDRLAHLLVEEAGSGAVALPAELPPPVVPPRPSLDDAQYGEAVHRAKEYIAAGDIFQVVPARRFTVQTSCEPLTLYRALRMVNPSPYMVLVEMPDAAVVGASPEMLVRKTGRRAELRPIAGTARRGGTAAEDRELAEELLGDPKERAEHVMLVDLGRNDLGRVAVPGGVRVASFMEIETYSHVIHLVSSVEADLRPDAGALDALLACFPAGTLSGAPKIRAMEIIDELEPEARGIYGGAIGYISYNGDMDTCIAIRTLVVAGGTTSITAGAGIVADSVPEREIEETKNKAAALLQAVALAGELEARR